MKNFFVLLTALLYAGIAYSQHSYRATVKDSQTREPLAGATCRIPQLNMGASADNAGLITLNNIPAGKYLVKFSYLGFRDRTDSLSFPGDSLTSEEVLLERADDEGSGLEAVRISATRSSRTIAGIPTRVEFISAEELEEKANMKPGDIRMLLSESTGIQTQQTSATSANSAIRIQGLDGKYTQIIRDGFPLYSGFSGGLGLLQIAPLDLRQVEVIKGSASTLYGGGAIAGLVNLVSRTPTEERTLDFLLNGTSALGVDASLFYGEQFDKTGLTVYAAYNHGRAYDPAGIGISAIPDYDRLTLNPRLWLYLNDRNTLNIGINSTVETRTGGDMLYLKGRGDADHKYFEQNKTGRYSTQAEFEHRFSKESKMLVRSSLSYFDRRMLLPGYRFSGEQFSSFSEAVYFIASGRSDWVVGLNFLSDRFRERPESASRLRNYTYNTVGTFVQNTFDIGRDLSVESGLRADYHNRYGLFLLPRASVLWMINPSLSTRLGGGLGYKAPTIFTEEAERIQFRGVLPLDIESTRAERSLGLNYDINYRTRIFGKLGFSVNQLFFYTRVNDPVLLTQVSSTALAYQQPSGNMNTKGMETNIKISYHNFKLFVGYTFADVHQKISGTVSHYPLVSKHRLNNVLMYELEDKWKIGAEAYYFSRQPLNDGREGKSYWTAGFMIERAWERFSLFINFENFTDTRQTRFDTIYTGSISDPLFRDIYAPVDGFVVNGGIKLRL